MRIGEYYAKGKLLLSGEYIVLFGAKALSVPLKIGQRMRVSELPDEGILNWQTYVLDKPWFNASYGLKDFKAINFSNEKTALFVQNLLKEGFALQNEVSLTGKGYLVENYIDFDMTWGLGSSSSLVSNLANWLDIDLYTFYKKVFNGSGYDVFTARADSPVTYQLKEEQPVITETSLPESITDNLYFVYLGHKRDSQESVRQFRARNNPDPEIIKEVSQITDAMISRSSAEDFFALMRLHEVLVGGILKLPGIKDERFPDFEGEIKSLGAWGGDFIMAGTRMSPDNVKSYFSKHNLPVIYTWNEIVFK